MARIIEDITSIPLEGWSILFWVFLACAVIAGTAYSIFTEPFEDDVI